MRTPKSLPEPLLGRLAPDDMAPWLREKWESLPPENGERVNVEVLANHPAAFDFYTNVFSQRFFDNTGGDMLVDYNDKVLFRCAVSRMNGCFVCNSVNTKIMLGLGYSQEQLDNILAPTREHFSEKELALLELAEQFTVANVTGQLTPELYVKLGKHFSDAAIIELGVMAAFFIGWQRLLWAYDLAPREDGCPIPAPGHQHLQVTA